MPSLATVRTYGRPACVGNDDWIRTFDSDGLLEEAAYVGSACPDRPSTLLSSPAHRGPSGTPDSSAADLVPDQSEWATPAADAPSIGRPLIGAVRSRSRR